MMSKIEQECLMSVHKSLGVKMAPETLLAKSVESGHS